MVSANAVVVEARIPLPLGMGSVKLRENATISLRIPVRRMVFIPPVNAVRLRNS